MLHALVRQQAGCQDYLTVELSVFLTKRWHGLSGGTAEIIFAYPTSIPANLS